MSKYDLITFDMDGTLLDSSKSILPSSIEAIEKAASAGKTVCLTTGRCMAETQEFLCQLPDIRYIIGASGAFIYDCSQKEYIYRDLLNRSIFTKIVNYIRDDDMQLVIMSETSYTQRDKATHMSDYNMGIYQDGYLRFFNLLDDICSFYLSDPFDIFKANIYSRTAEQRIRYYDRFKDLPLELVFAEGTSFEITKRTVTKGKAFSALCSLLGIAPERTIAVGDADNDLPVLSCAGLGIAMGNSNEHVLKAADVVVSDNDSGGCSEAVENYLLKI